MTDLFNYNILLNQAMKKVRNIRDPKSEKQEYVYYGFQEVQNKNVVSIGGSSHQIYVETTEKARKITVECLEAILIYLFKYYNYEVESVERAKIAFKVQFAILDKKILRCGSLKSRNAIYQSLHLDLFLMKSQKQKNISMYRSVSLYI